MFIQDNLRDLKATSSDWIPSSNFLIMFFGVVVGPAVLFAVGGRESGILWETGLAWSFLAIATILFISLSAGFSMFRREPKVISIRQN